MPSIYIINPAASYPSYHTAEAFGRADDGSGWVQVADLTIATVAAMVPNGWHIKLSEEAVASVDLESDADFIALTGKVSQRSRMYALADEFRRRGKTVLIGGSFASLSPDDVRPHADILVTGEIEEIASTLFADLAQGRWKDHYEGGKADIRLSPVPRWDLYPVQKAMSGALQTTRGCPFNCEFCDVIQYQGRKQRHKTVGQVMRELDALYQYGFRQVFIADDNFTVHRKHAAAFLEALTLWNEHKPEPIRFTAQASVDVARDDEMLEKCRAANLSILFVGVETINTESLRETGKRQNLLVPMEDAIDRIVGAGIAVQAGIIFGFDHDHAGTLGDLSSFFDRIPVPDLSIGALVAPPATHLYRRLAAEGRLQGEIWETAAGTLQTNIIPKQMSRDELLQGVTDLCRSAYDPYRYGQRMLRFIDRCGTEKSPGRNAAPRSPAYKLRAKAVLKSIQDISTQGDPEAAMVADILRSAANKPGVLLTALQFLSRYGQTRYFLDRVRTSSTVQQAA